MLDGLTTLITGGTGSFGTAFVASLLTGSPRKVIVLSRDECKQAAMRRAMPDPRLRFFLGDVRDLDRLSDAFRGVDVVVHAAALKHVPACEYDPVEAMLTNIVGSANVVKAAQRCGVGRLLALSTDKAVAPVNTYGKSKAFMEALVVRGNRGHGARCSCVRWGNVLGSRGSVLDVAAAGPIGITDPRMTRFWLPMPEVVAFALRCLGAMRGGEVFVPKAACRPLTEVLGAWDCVTGLRPGEKLHEVLIGPDERGVRDLGWAYVIEPQDPTWNYQPWEGTPMPEGFRFSSEG